MTYNVPIILNVSRNIILKGYNPIMKFKNKQAALTFVSKLRSRRFEDIHSGALFAFERADVFPINIIGPHIYWMDPARYPTTKVGRYVYGCYCLYENAEVMEDCVFNYNLPEGEVPNDPDAPMNIVERSVEEQEIAEEQRRAEEQMRAEKRNKDEEQNKSAETPKPKRKYNKKATVEEPPKPVEESTVPIAKRKYNKKATVEEPPKPVEESTVPVAKRKYNKKPKAELVANDTNRESEEHTQIAM